ncbi:DUF2624 domain-containing protein [Lederbergia graminis]|uniref:DUF2624 domain-containing protein n=1 Tax=Lederbergia graminis TaxID=735518 RepID=A0ABW0LMW3_9BACI
MNFLIKNIVRQRLNAATADEILKYAKEYGFEVTKQQAEYAANFLRGKNYDIFDDKTRAMIVREIAKIAGPDTARELNKLFIEFTS